MDLLSLVLIGFGTGAYGVLVGAGGGFILGPVLLIFFDLEPAVAAGTSLALVAINSISGSQVYRRLGLVDVRSGFLFATAAIPGSVLAPFVLTQVAPSAFRILFGLLLVGLAVQMVVRPRFSGSTRETKPRAGAMVRGRRIATDDGQVFEYRFSESAAAVFNLFLGFVSSFFGTGGGFLRTPILVSFFNFPLRVAVATSIFALSFYTTAGALTHASLGHVDWYPTFVWAGIGFVAGGQMGARLAGRVRGTWVLRLLLVVVLGLGIRLLVEGIRG